MTKGKQMKTANYTPEMEQAIAADYAAGVSVEHIANNVGKSVRSVVAKLSRLGIYKAKERTTKNGDPIVKKDALADQLGMLCGLSEAEADSLAKANKTALAKILDIVKGSMLDRNDVS